MRLFKTVCWLLLAFSVLFASGIAPQAYNLVQQSGVGLTRRTTLNFTGAGVTCVDSAGVTQCTIPGGGAAGYQTVQSAGVSLTQRNTLNFVAGTTCVDNSGATRTDCTTQNAILTVANEGTTGTTANTLTKLTGAPSTAIIAATTDTGGVIGITSSGAGTTGNALVILIGSTSCVFDGATTAGHYVSISSTVAGNCHDAGATYPTSGQILGRVLSTNGAGGTFTVDLFSTEIQGTVSPTTNQNLRSVGVTIDGGGTALSGTTTRCSQVNYAGTINEFSMVSDVLGSATVQVETVAFGSYTGPGSATDISNGGEVMTGATRKQDTTLTGWTTAVTANTVFCFVLSSPATVTWVSANVRIAAN